MDSITRFESQVTPLDNGCVEHRVHLNQRTGRAYFQDGGKRYIAARWYWAARRGPLKPGQCVLHRCDNPACVNLDHLFVGTQAENIIDRDNKGRNRLAATHCVRGHEFTDENTRWHGPDGKWRICRACGVIHTRVHRARTLGEQA